ncbi:hypothetical protein KY360_03630 [Candidatus Woesearchaeota archaeon]|nr:hypothetical protein [Candidatus Woesearchaeota archaeon]
MEEADSPSSTGDRPLFEDVGTPAPAENIGDTGFAPQQGVFPGEPDQTLENVLPQEGTGIPQASEMEEAAYQDAARQKAKEDMDYAATQLDHEEETVMARFRDRKLERSMGSIDKQVANALSPIKGLRAAGYRIAQTFGVNLYRRSVIRHKGKLEAKAVRLEDYVTSFKTKLESESDNDAGTDVREKGVSSQVRHYTRMCKGIAHMVRRLDLTEKAMLKQLAQNEGKIKEYESKVKDGTNEEDQNMLTFYQGRKTAIQEDIGTLRKQKKGYERKIKTHHGMNVTLQLSEINYERSIHEGEDMLAKARSTIILMDQYIDSCDSFKSLVDFQKEMQGMASDIRIGDKANETMQRALTRQYEVMHRRTGELYADSDPSKSLDKVKAAADRILAQEDATARQLVDLYSN